MQSKAKPPTKAERERMEMIVAHGCCACRSERVGSLHPVEVHHLIDGGKRRGHRFTVALCCWHHRGVPPVAGMGVKAASEQFGPSLHHDGRAFKKRYGGDNALLAFQEFLLILQPTE